MISSPVFFIGSLVLIFLVFCVVCVVVFSSVCLVPSVSCVFLSSPPIISCGVRVVDFVLVCVYIFIVPCCYVYYDYHMKRCSVRVYTQLFVGGLMSYLCCLFYCL